MAISHNPGKNSASPYPDGAELEKYVGGRKRSGLVWRSIFQLSTILGIVVLVALLYNVIDRAFGYVAVQNAINPADLVLAVQEKKLLALPSLTASEDDEVLAAGVMADPYAIGFFGFAYYLHHVGSLQALTVDGMAPNAESVDSGQYPLARPLFFYTTPEVLREKPQVADYIRYSLENVNGLIGDVGYFPATEANLQAGLASLAANRSVDPATSDRIEIAGSSTVYPLAQRLADTFQATGYGGEIQIQSIGSTAGINLFCVDKKSDLITASRPMRRLEAEACKKRRRAAPLEFRLGADALAVVVNRENNFLSQATSDQLRAIFGQAQRWSDVDPTWPDQPIHRYIPGADSGTLDFFVESIFDLKLHDLPKEDLLQLLTENISAGLLRRFESEKPLAERSHEEIYALVVERIVEPTVVRTWSLTDSLLHRSAVELEAADIADADLTFRSWITPDFLRSPQSSVPQLAGVRTAILGSLWVILITILFSLPIGVGAAIYLEEYATGNWFERIISTNISNLAGVPSIIYGMLGLAVFVRILEPLTSGAFLGNVDQTTANGRTVLSAGLTLGLLILPIVIINAQEAIRAVPNSLRQASYALGATKWQTIWNHVLPGALPGILTGAILSISRALGETAPLVVIGASTFIVVDPDSVFSKFTTLPIQIYQWTSRPQDEFRNIAAAAIIVLLVLLLTMNASAIFLRNRYSRRA